MAKNEPIIDFNILKQIDKAGADNKVYYKIHAGDTPEYQEPPDMGFACYSGLLGTLKRAPEKNFVSTRMEMRPTGIELTEEECYSWIDLCQVYGLLPWYVVPKDCIHPHPNKDKWHMIKLVLFTRDVPQSKLYAYLDNFRKLREDRGFVKAVLYLHLDRGIDFYIAYVLASHFHITNTGHHTLSISSGLYNGGVNSPKPADIEGKTNLMMARNLFKFACNHKQDLGPLVPDVTGWKCNSLITNISKTNLIVPVKSLLMPEISKIIREPDDKKAAELCVEFNENFK